MTDTSLCLFSSASSPGPASSLSSFSLTLTGKVLVFFPHDHAADVGTGGGQRQWYRFETAGQHWGHWGLGPVGEGVLVHYWRLGLVGEQVYRRHINMSLVVSQFFHEKIVVPIISLLLLPGRGGFFILFSFFQHHHVVLSGEPR